MYPFWRAWEYNKYSQERLRMADSVLVVRSPAPGFAYCIQGFDVNYINEKSQRRKILT